MYDFIQLFLFAWRTKELVVSVTPYLSGHNLPGALRLESTPAQEEAFARRQAETRSDQANCSLHNVLDDQPRSVDTNISWKSLVVLLFISCNMGPNESHRTRLFLELPDSSHLSSSALVPLFSLFYPRFLFHISYY